ncbi:hypothetical protein GYB29_05505, partial [bacterium]|nr:hypothetical protein [bacterium]
MMVKQAENTYLSVFFKRDVIKTEHKMHSLLKKTLLFTLFLPLLLLAPRAEATHVMGADITYKCVDSLKFEFTIKYYRDCRGVGFSNPSSQTSIRCLTGGSQGISLSLESIEEITPVCATASGGCQPSNTYGTGEGIEQHTYTGTIDFTQSPYNSLISSGCCKFRVITQQCCRNGAINTGAANQNFYTYADLDICAQPCNSSPSLTSEPIGILCCNQPFFYNNGASDTSDFDSLSYAWANPLTYNGANISYSGQYYAYNHPFQVYYPGSLQPPYTNPNASPPIGCYLDPLTGDIILTPTRCDEVTVAVIEVKEWRKDSTGTYKLIGTTRRDMQFITKTCPDNNPPEIDGPYAYNVCAGAQLCFNVTTDDEVFTPPPPAQAPPPDSVKISWNRGIPGATFTVTNPTARLQTGQFCWTPTLDQASDLPYTFTVTARDNACPLNAVTVRSFRVTVKPRAQAERNIDTLPCGRYFVESEPIAGFRGAPTYRWQILDSARNIVFDRREAHFASTNSFLSVKKSDTIIFRKGGFYIIQHTINNSPQNCPTTYYDTLIVPGPFRADLSIGEDTFICAKTTLTIQPYIYNGQAPYNFQWATMGIDDDGNTLPNGVIRLQDTLPYYDLTLPEGQYDTAIALFARDGSGCTTVDTIRVFQKQNPRVYLPEDPRICTYDSVLIIPSFDTAYWVDRVNLDSAGNPDTVRQGDTLFKKWFLNGASSY